MTCAVLGFATQAVGATVVSDALGGIGVLGIPAGAAIGVLRFGLFDIDR
ncbi:MAG TPA: hypothetical protein VHJ18_28595 [Streptosporangiaceae bacterium]|nr:hypothetical protein [Streptosporangiaceae bacterium]